jgi:hypothetical protein
MQEQKRSVGVYQVEDTIYIVGKSSTTEYKVLAELPPERVMIGDAPEIIGRAVASAMGRCRFWLDQPGTKADVLAMELGAKDWKDLVKKSRYCSITEADDNEKDYRVSICKKSGVYGFDATGDEFTIEKENDSKVGELVKKALAGYRRK